jgi:hypothetical protein
MQLRRRILRGEATSMVLFFLLLTGFLALWPVSAAQACWNTLERQCFSTTTGVDSVNILWPWQHPTGSGRRWRRNPAYPPYVTWGLQRIDYDDHLCIDDQTALWCIGGPPANDPRFNNYPANYGSYVAYGPLNLGTATAAQVSFWMWDRTEAQHDSIFWGAATAYPLPTNAASIQLAGGHSDNMIGGEFQPEMIDLSALHNAATGADTSLLGSTTVYVFWWFVSDANAQVAVGAFIDNVLVNVDDGGVNMQATSLSVMRTDSVPMTWPQELDTALAMFRWTTCTGGTGIYPAFRVMGLYDTTIIFDSLVTTAGEGQDYTFWSHPFVFSPDTHVVRFVIDTLNEVTETVETDNFAYQVVPITALNRAPHFRWIYPDASGPAVVDTGIWLKWVCWDSLEISTVNIYADLDTNDCTGVLVPGGSHQEPISMLEPPVDSMFWNLRGQPNGYQRNILAHVLDESHDSCYYAPFPVRVRHAGAVDPLHESAIPEKFFLSQNFPNPFNPSTDLQYGIHTAGLVRLTVYDLLGREVAVLVNKDLAPGTYRTEFSGSKLPSGIYLYTLTTPEGTQSQKMMLLK